MLWMSTTGVGLPHDVTLVSGTQHSDLIILHYIGHHPSPNIIIILLSRFPMMYFSSLWLIYFITGIWYLLIPFTYFAHPPPILPMPPSALWQPPVCSPYLWICFCLKYGTFLNEIHRIKSSPFSGCRVEQACVGGCQRQTWFRDPFY